MNSIRAARSLRFPLNKALIKPISSIRSSLRAKLLILFIILTTIPISVVGVVSYATSLRTVQENITSSTTQLANQLNKSVELVFRETERFLKIGMHETTIRFVNPYQQTEERTYQSALEIIGLFKLFRSIYEFDEQIKGIYILGFNGNNISEAEGRFSLDMELDEIPTVRRILSNPGEVFYTPNYRSDFTHSNLYEDVISVGRAIIRISTQDIMGVIIVDLDRNAIEELCRNLTIGDTGFFSIVTPEGHFIYPRSGEQSMEKLKRENLLQIAHTEGGNFVQRVDGEKEFFIYNTLEHSGWKIVGSVKMKEIMRGAHQIRSLTLIVVVLCIIFAVILYFFISDALTHPLIDLQNIMAEAESGNFEVRAEGANTVEIAHLSHSFNVMIEKIQELLDIRIKEQEELKKSELKALQAQINPHFLYNTLDAIVWMTEANDKKQVVKMTKTLSTFFRIVLSGGEEWISIQDEIEHIKSYLTIQKMRYRDILDYQFDVDPGICTSKILKLTLQPLVENAIYHGIKNIRGGGTVAVTGRYEADNHIFFQVTDNGRGIDADKLAELHLHLSAENVEISKESGYGLINVNQRLKLYYGSSYGLNIASKPGKGTEVFFTIPRTT